MDAQLLNTLPEDCSTRDVAQALGMAVRSVQLMVDRGELQAWKTPGGHRRIARASVLQWLAQRGAPTPADLPAPATLPPGPTSGPPPAPPARRPQVLLIEDSVHFQNLVRLLLAHDFPQVDLHVAEDGIVGLAMAGQLQPELLLVDILLPGVDGATLISRLRSHPQFQHSRLIVITSLDEAQREPYAFALDGLPVVHKPRLVQDLPQQLQQALAPA
ncbi:MAG: response regulator [Comamonadaceae bacterium]|nr:response regulator [Comamonadaceae bacterium]